MNFITSEDMRARDKMIVENLTATIHPHRGFGIFKRAGDDPREVGMVAAFNLFERGYPELVISGMTQISLEQHVWVLDNSVKYMTTMLPIQPMEEYADLLNAHYQDIGLGMAYKAVVIDTQQYLWGFGMNIKRYYEGKVNAEDMTFIQIIECGKDGKFPEKSSPSQILFETKPFGYKEITNDNSIEQQNV